MGVALSVAAAVVVFGLLVALVVTVIARELASAFERSVAAGTRAQLSIPTVTLPAEPKLNGTERLDAFDGDPARTEDAPVTAADLAFHAPWESTVWADE